MVPVAQYQASRQNGARRQATVVGDDGDVVALVHADRQRLPAACCGRHFSDHGIVHRISSPSRLWAALIV